MMTEKPREMPQTPEEYKSPYKGEMAAIDALAYERGWRAAIKYIIEKGRKARADRSEGD